MTMSYPLFKKRTRGSGIGLYALFLLLILNPFHFIIATKFLYYREILALIFAMLWFHKVLVSRSFFAGCPEARQVVFYFVLFPILLILFAIIDPGRKLYGSDLLMASVVLETVSPVLYVLRNAFLYIPMVLYFYVRGITEKEVRLIALVTMIVAPFSIIAYLNHSGISTGMTFGIVAQLGGVGLSYNTYVPYLTFPILSAIYLIASRSNLYIKIISISILAPISIYVLFSTSRQSFLFTIICGLVFFLKSKDIKSSKKIVFIFIIMIFAMFIIQNITAEYSLSNKFLNRYSSVSSVIDTSRLEIAKHGLELLQPHEYFIGAGLTSVIVSGPHNDYIRWLQRIGFFAAVIGFLPFLLAALKGSVRIRYSKFNALNIYITLSIFFIIHHSLFGYPREDSYQALYCFLGLAMWLGLEREKFAKTQHIKRQAGQTF